VLSQLAQSDAVKSQRQQVRPDGPKHRLQGNRVLGTLIHQKVHADPFRMKASEPEDKMATMALPIRELELSVRVGTEKARAETECVVFYAHARAVQPSFTLLMKYGFYTTMLKWILLSLARSQKSIIALYQKTDFTPYSSEEILRVAKSLDSVVEAAQPILCKLQALGPRAQAWLGSAVLAQLAQQLEHMDSIAESLHVAADEETTALLAMAVEEFSAVSELAMQ